jgi:hypothetical protein
MNGYQLHVHLGTCGCHGSFTSGPMGWDTKSVETMWDVSQRKVWKRNSTGFGGDLRTSVPAIVSLLEY